MYMHRLAVRHGLRGALADGMESAAHLLVRIEPEMHHMHTSYMYACMPVHIQCRRRVRRCR